MAQIFRSRSILLPIMGLILLAAVGLTVFVIVSTQATDVGLAVDTTPGAMPSSPEIEATYGIRPVLVALTDANGLIDFRFQILDPDKAGNMHGSFDTLPHFITPSGVDIRMSRIPTHHNFLVGRTYYMLFANANNAVKPGDKVTLVMGDIRVENVPVR
jgi:hypothetical protein